MTEKPPCFAAVEGNGVQRAVLIVSAFDEERDGFAVRGPADPADVDLAGDKRPRVSFPVDDMQFSPSRTIFALKGAARNVERVSDVAAVGRDLDREDRSDPGDVFWGQTGRGGEPGARESARE